MRPLTVPAAADSWRPGGEFMAMHYAELVRRPKHKNEAVLGSAGRA